MAKNHIHPAEWQRFLAQPLPATIIDTSNEV